SFLAVGTAHDKTSRRNPGEFHSDTVCNRFLLFLSSHAALIRRRLFLFLLRFGRGALTLIRGGVFLFLLLVSPGALDRTGVFRPDRFLMRIAASQDCQGADQEECE